jgi:UDP-glucose 4-epimerase
VTSHSWVVGRGGLLGRHVEASLLASGANAGVWRPTTPFRWEDVAVAPRELELAVAGFFRRVGRSDRPWRVLWCAGAGVVATSPKALAQETSLVTRFLGAVTDHLSGDPQLAQRGTLFFASSAGAVYAASPAGAPFDENSPVGALAPYGHEKLAQERLFEQAARASGSDLVIGRLSNLYGPGQNLTKPQGLVSHVGLAALRREPVSIYVPLDTIRDYLFAPDAGPMVVELIERQEDARHDGAPRRSITKIFASETETTVASVLHAWRQALRRPLRVALAANPAGRLQPRLLSFRSRICPEVRRQPTLLPLGVEAVRRDQLRRLMATGAR